METTSYKDLCFLPCQVETMTLANITVRAVRSRGQRGKHSAWYTKQGFKGLRSTAIKVDIT